MICPICRNNAERRLEKSGVSYSQCGVCKLLFSMPLDNSNKVGGDSEEIRNQQHNQTRIDRVISLGGIQNVLDFGCGSGLLVKAFNARGISCIGYDKFSAETNRIPDGPFDAITCIEVIEHTTAPFPEIEIIGKLLRSKGVLYLETSFVDIASDDKIPLEQFDYINPALGHSTIFSHLSLDILMCKNGLSPARHINRNVRIFTKP